eukprot:6651291-Prymnesium_polylepis.1
MHGPAAMESSRDAHRAKAQRLDAHRMRAYSRGLVRDTTLQNAMTLGCKQRLKKRWTFSY